MFIWLVLLLPLRLLLCNLGVSFVVIGRVVNLGWLGLGFRRLRKECNESKWGREMLVY